MRAIPGFGQRDSGEGFPLGLTLVAGLVAAAVVLPLSWLFIRAVTVDPFRAWGMLVRQGNIEVAINSLLLMIGVTVLSVLIGVPLAYLTVRTDLPFRRFWTIVVALPLVIPSYIGAFAFVSAFGQNGEFQDLLAPLGIEQVPEIYGLTGSIFVITLYTYPYVFLTVRAALLSLDTTLIDAARILNHSNLSAFRRVTIPHILPATIAGGLLAALYTVSDFGTPAIMRLPVFTRQIYVEINSFGQDYAALLSLQLLTLVLFVLALERWIHPDETVEGDADSSGESRVKLGVWRWPAMAVPALVATVALVVPLWILGLWLVRADTGGRSSYAFEIGHIFNSVSLSLAAAVLAALAALPVAYYAAKYDSRLANLFERTTYIGFAVPGIVLALALVYFGSSYVAAFYQTIYFLVFAYVIRFLSQAVGIVRTSLLQVDPSLVEAARTLGESSAGAFRRVTLRLIFPGVTAGAALVFLTTMKELPVTLLLRPSGYQTLATQIWRAQEFGFYQYAAVPALLLLLVSGLSMVVLLRQGEYNV